MSDYKFVIYEKLDGDAHTSRMLEEEHHGNVPEEITDKQLDPHHVGEPDYIMEKLLEKNRTGAAEVVLEKNLDTSKDQFGSKHRNPSAYEGDINKLEEKRVAEYNREKSEYEVASETAKRQRWWEVKGKDGLKIASRKIAQTDLFGDPDWDWLDSRDDDHDLEEDPLDALDEGADDLFDGMSFDFDVDDMDDSDDVLKEVHHEVVDVGGTPENVGTIKVDRPEYYDGKSDPRLAEDLKDLMSVNHNDLPFSMKMFDFSRLDSGVITYRVGSMGEDFSIDDVTASTKFSITVATKKN